MSQDTWNAVDGYIAGVMIPEDPAADALKAQQEAGLPAINVAPNHGKLLHLVVRMIRARRVLEIGTLGGYSTIWMASALPAEGRLVTLEFDPRHADVAGASIERAGLAGRVEIRVGRAIDSLPRIAEEKGEPFDLVFIDADKQSTAAYFDWALRLTHAGSVIIVDNVVRAGNVVDAAGDANVQGIRAFNERLAAEPRVSATALQTVGIKGYDGFAIALVN